MGALEIFVEAMGPQFLLDRLQECLATPADSEQPLAEAESILVDFIRMVEQDKHKASSYITEEMIKLLCDLLLRCTPSQDAQSSNDKNARKEKKKQKSKQSRQNSRRSLNNPSEPPKRRAPVEASSESDVQDDANSYANGHPASSSTSSHRRAHSSSNLADSRDTPVKRRAAPKQSPSPRGYQRQSFSSPSLNGAALDPPREETRADEIKRTQSGVRRLVLQLWTRMAESDVSLVRKLITARFLARLRKLLGSKLLDEPTLVSLMNCLKPFFIVRAHQRSLVEEGVLAALIKFVARPGSPTLQYAAFDLLLYFDEMYQRELLNAGVLSASLRLLGSATPQIRTRALELLSFFNRNYQEDMINEGIFSQIISLLNLPQEASSLGSSNQVLSSLLLRSLNVVSHFESMLHPIFIIVDGLGLTCGFRGTPRRSCCCGHLSAPYCASVDSRREVAADLLRYSGFV